MVLEYTFCCGNGNLLFLRTVDNFRFSKSHSHGFGIHLLLRQRKSPFSSHGGQFSFFKITQPWFWNTPSVAATEISFFFARWTIFVFQNHTAIVLEYTFCCGNGNLLFLRTVDNFRFSKSHSHRFGIHLLLRQRKSPFSSHGGQFSFFSSEPSRQSSFPSQNNHSGMHR